MSQRSVPAPFLSKTYELVEDASTDDVVSWNESGRTFVVWKIDDFCKNLLPAYFNHNNFSSFVRQLNTYGFSKIVPDKWEFSNEKFKRGHKDLLTEICRRKSITTTSTYSPSIQGAGKCGNSDVVAAGSRPKSSFNSGEYLSTSTSSSRGYSRNRPSSVETSKACKLEVINQELKRENEKLNYEVTRTKKQFQELIGFLSQHVKVDPKLLTGGSEDNGLVVDKERNEDNNENEEYYCLKLFGVCLKQKNKNRT